MSKSVRTEDEVKLHYYSYRGELEEIKNLVEQKNVDVNCKDKNGETALHHVSYNGNLDIVKYLVENNANLQCKDDDKYTPLHKAIRQGRLEVVKYLVEKGAKSQPEDHDGWSLVHWAVFDGYINILKYLADKKYDLECRDKNGNTPLYQSLAEEGLEMVKFLVEENVDYDTKNNEGVTPLFAACCMQTDVALYLAKLNSDIHISCRGGTTPLHRGLLHRATKEGHIELTKYFLSKNADWQCVDSENETSFHKALKSRKPELAKLFIDLVHNDSKTRLDRDVNRNGFYQIWDYHQTLFFKAPRWNLSFKSEMDKLIEQYCDESVICRFKDGPLGVHFLKQPIKLECGHSYCLDYKDLLDYEIYDHLKFENNNNPRSLCESFINTSNNAFKLVTQKYEVINKRVFKNAIGFIRIKGETYTGDIGFKKNKKYYSELNKIYGDKIQSGDERDLTLIGIWRHIRDTAHPSNRYVILGLESLVKSVQSAQDLERLIKIYDYTLSFIKRKTASRDKEQIPEMKMRIDIYLEETKKKLSELCNNEILVNVAIEKLSCLCDEITVNFKIY